MGTGYKNIILLSDGTGNSSAKLFKTNVWRVYQALDLADPKDPEQPRQFAFYDNGVGSSSFKPLAALGGAVGVGLSRNVRDLYTFGVGPTNRGTKSTPSALAAEPLPPVEGFPFVRIAMNQWQQFIVRAIDERGDPITDFHLGFLARMETPKERSLSSSMLRFTSIAVMPASVVSTSTLLTWLGTICLIYGSE
jgi:hypothetical protein